MARGSTWDDHEPVVVLKTSRDDDLVLAKSMLMSADIPFFTKNELITDLFGWGRVGGASGVTGPLEIVVAPRDAKDAYEILKSLDRSGTTTIDPSRAKETAHADKREIVFTTANKSELKLIESQLEKAGIPFKTSSKMIEHAVQVQVMVAQKDVDAAKAVCSLPQEDSEISEGASVPMHPGTQASTGDLSSGLWGFAPRTIKTIAFIAIITSVVTMLGVALFSLSNLGYSSPPAMQQPASDAGGAELIVLPDGKQIDLQSVVNMTTSDDGKTITLTLSDGSHITFDPSAEASSDSGVIVAPIDQ